MLNLLKGMGKAYKEAQKAKKLDKAFQLQRTDEYAPFKKLSEETEKLNKQLNIAKKVGIGTAGAIAGAGVYGKAKQAFKEKKKDKNND